MKKEEMEVVYCYHKGGQWIEGGELNIPHWEEKCFYNVIKTLGYEVLKENEAKEGKNA